MQPQIRSQKFHPSLLSPSETEIPKRTEPLRTKTAAELFFPTSILDDPCDTENVIDKRLKTYGALLEVVGDAITAMLQHRLNAFDALVGENRCEVRALQLFELTERLNQGAFTKLLLLRDFDNLRGKRGAIKGCQAVGKTLRQILADAGLDLSLSDETKYLFLCFVLTLTKRRDADNIDRTDSIQLTTYYPKLTTRACRRLVRYYQTELARSSTHYLIALADRWNEGEQVEKTVRTDARERPAAPTLMGLNYIIRALICDRRPVVVRLNLVFGGNVVASRRLLFQGDRFMNFTYVGEAVETLAGMNLDSPLYTIEACRVIHDYEHIGQATKAVTHLNLYRAILAFCSHKLHYPMSKNLDGHLVPKTLEQQGQKLRQLPGYSLEDPSVFCMTHIFTLSGAEVLANEISVHPMPRGLAKGLVA